MYTNPNVGKKETFPDRFLIRPGGYIEKKIDLSIRA